MKLKENALEIKIVENIAEISKNLKKIVAIIGVANFLKCWSKEIIETIFKQSQNKKN